MSAGYKEIGVEFISENKDYFNLLIVTATEIEKQEVHSAFKPIEGYNQIVKTSKGKNTYFLGKFGEYNTVHVACDDMGATSRNGSIVTTTAAIDLWEPKAVLMIGIAFGANATKQKIGDIIIAERIVSYESQRVGIKKENRGKEGPASSLLVNRFKSITDWEYLIGKRKPKLNFGMVLSGEKLIDDEDFKKQLLEAEPTAVGGEMEGAGIYSACDDKVNHWILVKGICDFADGNKGKRKKHNQKIAISSAVDLCKFVFSSPHAFADIPLIPASSIQVAQKKKIVDILASQVERQIKRQENSEKYIPATFIEIGSVKDHLRYLSDPVLYIEKCLNEARVKDFRALDKAVSKKNLSFSYNHEDFIPKSGITLSTVREVAGKHLEQLNNYQAQINSMPNNNDIYSFTYRLRDNIEDFAVLKKRVAIITEMPGQGKTNFICDYAQNFLLKRNVPAIFILGTEIHDDLRKSIRDKVYPDDSSKTFLHIISELNASCHENNKPFIIIIDGLNENGNPIQLSENLESFISEMLEYDFVRVILTCRTEYYNANFHNIETSSFKDEIVHIKTLHAHRTEEKTAEKIFRIYFDHFKIKWKSVSAEVYGQLVENFLLLRIFCDAYRGKNVGDVHDIYKEELFNRYFEVKTKEVGERLNKKDEFGIGAKVDIRKFIFDIIEYMIKHNRYANIPFDDIITDADQRKMYVRFLDENILVRRDLSDNLFASENVNFTFDEFRDFLISKYLIEVIYAKSVDEFTAFLEHKLEVSSAILEGCGTFLFHASRKNGDKQLIEIIERQHWYSKIFEKCIFHLKDEFVEEKDRIRVFESLQSFSYWSSNVVRSLIDRTDLGTYKNLNIQHLLEHARTLDESRFKTGFTGSFTSDKYGNGYGAVRQKGFLEVLEEKLTKGELLDKDHNLFEMLIYMLLNDGRWEIASLYEKYNHRYPDRSLTQLQLALTSKNSKLIDQIRIFCNNYDIRI